MISRQLDDGVTERLKQERRERAKAVPGRYTMQITATVYANNRREAYTQIESALSRRNDGVEYVDAEDIKIEPYCLHVLSVGMEYGGDRDLAEPGSALCATCQKIDRLIVGQKYNVFELRELVIGWTGSNIAGYSIEAYFDGDGRYLGPDADGIEPLFDKGDPD